MPPLRKTKLKGQHKCIKCSKLFERLWDRNRHANNCKGPKLSKCPVCGMKRNNRGWNFKRHIESCLKQQDKETIHFDDDSGIMTDFEPNPTVHVSHPFVYTTPSSNNSFDSAYDESTTNSIHILSQANVLSDTTEYILQMGTPARNTDNNSVASIHQSMDSIIIPTTDVVRTGFIPSNPSKNNNGPSYGTTCADLMYSTQSSNDLIDAKPTKKAPSSHHAMYVDKDDSGMAVEYVEMEQPTQHIDDAMTSFYRIMQSLVIPNRQHTSSFDSGDKVMNGFIDDTLDTPINLCTKIHSSYRLNQPLDLSMKNLAYTEVLGMTDAGNAFKICSNNNNHRVKSDTVLELNDSDGSPAAFTNVMGSKKIFSAPVTIGSSGQYDGECFNDFDNGNLHNTSMNEYLTSNDQRSVHPKMKYVCDFPDCGRAYKSKNGLNGHIRAVHLKIEYVCDVPDCGRVFKSKIGLNYHTEAVHFENTFVCDVPDCGREFVSKSGLIFHNKAVHLKIKYVCDVCGRVFKSKNGLNDHTEAVHLKIEYVCDVPDCGRVFKSKIGLNYHTEAVHFENTFVCDVPDCGREFVSKSGLIFHNKAVHLKIKYVCDVCGRVFKSKNGLNDHTEAVHLKIEYVCDVPDCGRVFKSKIGLNYHTEAVHFENTFVCDVPDCGREFVSKSGLIHHDKAEHLKIEYVCDVPDCGRVFKSKNGLNEHISAVHFGIVFVCNYTECAEEFSTKKSLKRHDDFVHSQVYKCEWKDCTFVAPTRCSLLDHIFRHYRHPEALLKQPDPFDYEKLAPLVDAEIASLKKTISMFRARNIELRMPETIYYVRDEKIMHRPFDAEKDIAAACLIYIPRKIEFQIVGEVEGHYITTIQRNKWKWMLEQVRICKNPLKSKCIHLVDDISKGIKFEYAESVIIAAATSQWLILNLKFTANHYSTSSNRIDKPPAWLTQWNADSKKLFIKGLPSIRFRSR